jgi:hypothetical protein
MLTLQNLLTRKTGIKRRGPFLSPNMLVGSSARWLKTSAQTSACVANFWAADVETDASIFACVKRRSRFVGKMLDLEDLSYC